MSAATVGEPVSPAGAEHDAGAGLRQGPGERDAEPRGRPGDDRDLIVKPELVQD